MAKEALTTDHGVPVIYNQNSLAVMQHGPILLKDVHLIEKEEMTL